MTWTIFEAPSGLSPPRPITVRAQSIPGRHYFPEHDHRWNQLVYAISGVLTVAVEGRSFVISPPVGPHLLLTSQARSKLVSLVDLFNSASIDAFTTQHRCAVLHAHLAEHPARGDMGTRTGRLSQRRIALSPDLRTYADH